jgi:catechol 2,3-dioxygenase-like lactoylglutathione lyase family enzyme
VGNVVDDLAAATAFFVELGLELQGEGQVEGGWVDRVVGLEGVRAEIAMVETPDGHGRLELVKFHSPSVRGGDGHAPANTLGIRHVAFAVDAVVASLRARGAKSAALTRRRSRNGTSCRSASRRVPTTHPVRPSSTRMSRTFGRLLCWVSFLIKQSTVRSAAMSEVVARDSAWTKGSRSCHLTIRAPPRGGA